MGGFLLNRQHALVSYGRPGQIEEVRNPRVLQRPEGQRTRVQQRCETRDRRRHTRNDAECATVVRDALLGRRRARASCTRRIIAGSIDLGGGERAAPRHRCSASPRFDQKLLREVDRLVHASQPTRGRSDREQHPVARIRQEPRCVRRRKPESLVDLMLERERPTHHFHQPVANCLRAPLRIGVGRRLELATERAAQPGLLLDLADGTLLVALAPFDLPFGERPVVVLRPMDEQDLDRRPGTADNDAAGGTNERAQRTALRAASSRRSQTAGQASRAAALRSRSS